MRRMIAALIAIVLPARLLVAQQEIENVAAFARLYGATRWFYPSDAAATLDWNRFAVHGVSRARSARSAAELEKTLEALFTPLGPRIDIGTSLPAKPAPGKRDASLIGWHYRGAGITEMGGQGPYSAKRMNRVTLAKPALTSSSGIMSQVLATGPSLRGQTIRMTARVRVADGSTQGWAGLWLRVDRDPPPATGFFDNMQDRPVRDTSWREYVIEGPVATDARQIVFGVLATGNVSVDVDGFELSTRTSNGAWTPVAIADPSFETPTNIESGWAQGGTSYGFTRVSTGAPHGTRFARITPQAPPPSVSQSVATPADSLEMPIVGATVDIDLGSGLKARLPLSLTDAEARAESSALTTLRAALANVAAPAGKDDADVRLADAVVAWNVLRHFSPYWGDISVDWDARLRPQLTNALNAQSTRQGHLDAVRSVVADARDGHGSVRDIATSARQAALPVQFRILDSKLVVTASRNPDVPVGSVVTTIDGAPASARMRTETQLASGTLQWQQTRAENALELCNLNSTVTLTIELPSGAVRDAKLPCAPSTTPVAETRPAPITQLQPGLWYVDLTRATVATLRPMLDTLAKARGVVFDMRGYPTDAGYMVLPYLMRTPENPFNRWMHTSRIAQPFGGIVGWSDATWSLQPATPQIAGQRVFLTDGRAISYAESVMGYVRDYKLGTIIGGTTAGANGNIASFTLPGGFSMIWTGMRVTRHDGRTPFHTQGVGADIPLEPTLAGIRAGRDEVLERALAMLRVQP